MTMGSLAITLRMLGKHAEAKAMAREMLATQNMTRLCSVCPRPAFLFFGEHLRGMTKPRGLRK